MKNTEVVLRNPSKSQRELQNMDLARPSDRDREANLRKTRQELGMLQAKTGQPAFLSTQLQKQRNEDDSFVRYKPIAAATGVEKMERIIQITTA